MVRFAEIETAFKVKNPNATIKKISGGVSVNYGGYKNYSYHGTNEEIAEKLKVYADVIGLNDHGTKDFTGKFLKLKISIFGKEVDATINDNKILFWYDYRYYMGESYCLKLYKGANGYFFNLDSNKVCIGGVA
jgi:hypothetical protein